MAALIFVCLSCNQVDQTAPGGSTLTLTAQPTSINSQGTSTLTVGGARATGAPLPDGTVVHFQVQQAGTVSPNPVETKNGIATSFFHAGGFSGDVVILATSGGISSASVTVTVGEARPTHVFVSASPSVLPPSGGTSHLRAVVTDNAGNQLQGVGVQFSTTLGTLGSGGKILRTDQNGAVDDNLTLSPGAGQTNSATVTATTLNNASGTTTVSVSATQFICGATNSQSDINVGDTVIFTDTSQDPANQIRRFIWDFGDGDHAEGRTVSHTFNTAGSFNVLHTVQDSAGNTSFCMVIPITVTEPVSGLTCSFTSSPTNPLKGQRVTLDASASADTTGTITSYTWSFGDGPQTVTTSNPVTTHTYNQNGTFTVNLVVEDNNGDTCNFNATVMVGP